MILRKGLMLGTAVWLLITVSFVNAKADDHKEGYTRSNGGKFAGTFLTSRIYTNSHVFTHHLGSLGGGKSEITDVLKTLGGTGKFEGASETAEAHCTNTTQAGDGNVVPSQSFGSFTGELTETIILP